MPPNLQQLEIFLQEPTCLVEIKGSSFFVTTAIIINVSPFNNSICSCLPKRLTLWRIIWGERFAVQLYLFHMNGHMCNFCSGCLAVGQILNPLPTISLQMADKVYSPHACISLSDVHDQEKFIVIIILRLNWSIVCFLHEDVCFDAGHNVSIIVCKHHCQREVGKKHDLVINWQAIVHEESNS